MTRYAINFLDLDHEDLRVPAQFMVAPVTPNRKWINVKKGEVDGQAVVLECEEDRAKAICEFVQKAARDRKLLVRCYREGPRGGWKELPRQKGNA